MAKRNKLKNGKQEATEKQAEHDSEALSEIQEAQDEKALTGNEEEEAEVEIKDKDVPDPHRNYELEQVESGNLAYAEMEKVHKQEALANKFMNAGMTVFVIGIAIQSLRMFFMRNETSSELFAGPLGIACNAIILGGILLYFIAFMVFTYIPATKWKCPACEGGLPIVKPSGRKFKVINQNALAEVEARDIRIGHIGRSGMIIPEFCPHCGEKLLNLDISKRKKTPRLKDLKEKANQSSDSTESSASESSESSS